MTRYAAAQHGVALRRAGDLASHLLHLTLCELPGQRMEAVRLAIPPQLGAASPVPNTSAIASFGCPWRNRMTASR